MKKQQYIVLWGETAWDIYYSKEDMLEALQDEFNEGCLDIDSVNIYELGKEGEITFQKLEVNFKRA